MRRHTWRLRPRCSKCCRTKGCNHQVITTSEIKISCVGLTQTLLELAVGSLPMMRFGLE